jgi:hypothetical protein
VRESACNRSYSTFSSGEIINTHQFDFSGLFVLDDEELTASGAVTYHEPKGSYLLLLPITGDLQLEQEAAAAELITVGNLKLIRLTEDTTIKLSNLYPKDNISYLRLLITADELDHYPGQSTVAFDLAANEDKLLQISPAALPFTVKIGRYKGRQEDICTIQPAAKGVFIFVIAGAFEIENRLLQMRDGLLLTGAATIEFEALSEGAVLLMIELS